MANGVSFINVLCSTEFKKEYKLALAKEEINMTSHIMTCCEALIKKHETKKKK